MKYISWIVIIGSFALFQIHSGFAWVEITGSDAGWAWSIMFELSAIYFWARKENDLGKVASVVVLCMASFNISKEARVEIADTRSQSQKMLDIATDKFKKMDSNDTPITMQKTMAFMGKMVDREDTDKTKPNKLDEVKIDYSLWIGIVLQMVALSFILLAQIKAIIFIRDGEVITKVKPKGNDEVTESNSDTDSQEVVFAKELIMNFTSYIRANGNISVNKLLGLLHVDGELNVPGNTYTKIVSTAKGEGGIGMSKMIQIDERLKEI